MKNLFLVLLFPLCSIGQNVSLINEKMSSCDNSENVDLVINRVAEKYISNDTLYLSIGNRLNCCFDPKTTVQFKNDTLQILQENKSELYCACDCCFSQDFTITGVFDTNFVVKYNGKILNFCSQKRLLFPDELELNFSSINKINKQGEKTGLWVIRKPEYNLITDYSTGKPNWGILYSKEGKRKSTYIYFDDKNPGLLYDEYELKRELKMLNSKVNPKLDFVDFSKLPK